MPPLLGFYAKYYVIVAAINAADLLWLALAIVLASAVSLFLLARGGDDVLFIARAASCAVRRLRCSTPELP
ncbi:MAG: hypothetical protein R2845_03995 [Thermomicrobiales bacterium]